MNSIPRSGSAVTPHDTNNLAKPGCLFVGTAGNLTVLLADMADADTPIVLKNIPSGSFVPLVVKRVTTASTAADIVVFPELP
jgi:hypothetical protein